LKRRQETARRPSRRRPLIVGRNRNVFDKNRISDTDAFLSLAARSLLAVAAKDVDDALNAQRFSLAGRTFRH
jgi:hypothetical protein